MSYRQIASDVRSSSVSSHRPLFRVEREVISVQKSGLFGRNKSKQVELEVEVYALEGVSFKMVRVPGKDFAIGQTEVTQALWRAVTGKSPSNFKGDQRPVEKVSWEDCISFCNQLSEKLG